MDESSSANESLSDRIQQLEQGNSDLEQELSEAKRINEHLDQLHKLEVAKNTSIARGHVRGVVRQLELVYGVTAVSAEREEAMIENTEVVRQLDFLHGVVTAEREDAVIVAVKAKENEDLMSRKLNHAEKRTAGLEQEIEHLKKKLAAWTKGNSDLEKELSEAKRINEHLDQLHKLEVAKNTEVVRQLELLHSVVTTVSAEREDARIENTEVVRQLELLHGVVTAEREDAVIAAVKAKENEDLMSRKLNHAEKRQAALQEQLKTLTYSIDEHRDKLQMIQSNKLITDGVSSLREYHAQQRIWIMDLLNDGKSYLQEVVVNIEEKLGNSSIDRGSGVASEETRSMKNVVQPTDSSKSVAQALQEKHEERHLLEVRAALRGTLDELLRNIKQATKERVDALMELAEVKQEYQLLLETTIQERQGSLTDSSEGKMIVDGRDGMPKNLKRKSSLKRLFSAKENLPPVADTHVEHEESSTNVRSSLTMDNARLQIENANVKDNMRSLKCLTSNIRKLRLSLMQAKDTPMSEATSNETWALVDKIIWEAELVKNALGSPFWSGEANMASSSASDAIIVDRDNEETNTDAKIDSVSAAGLEMVELLILAAQISKEKMKK